MAAAVEAAATPSSDPSCDNANGDDWQRLWKDAESWSGLLNANRAFLRGEMSQSPYYRGKISEETKPLVEGLLKLHDYGFLTYSSQPARDDKDAYFIECTCCAKCSNRNGYHQRKQRAFLSFLFPSGLLGTDMVSNFNHELMKEVDIHSSVLVYRHFCKDGCCRIGADAFSSFPPDWATHMSREGPTYKEAVESEFESRQFMDVFCGRILDAFIAINPEVTSDANPFVYHILAKDWEPCDIAQHVAAAAERAGLSSALLERAEDGSQEEHESSSEKEAEESGEET